jgi:hypothetical protein
VGFGAVLVEGPFDLDPSGLSEVSEGGFLLAWIDGVQALFADYLAYELGGVGHDLVAELYAGAAGPDILGELPLHYLIYEIEAPQWGLGVSWLG